MPTFNEQINKVIENVNSLITSETKDDDIEKLQSLKDSINSLNDMHTKVVDDYASMKDKYIESITRTGTSLKVSETGDPQPKSFEEIAEEIIAKRK